MLIQINTDSSVEADDRLNRLINSTVESSLSRFSDRITRVEVHLSDINAGKAGDRDKQCLMEARVAGRKPIVASDQSATLDQAVNGAADKLKRAVESLLGKMAERQ
ncbi:MAG: HPF/RaiA family ribosome-associated protein [Gemmatimonadales bacterium]